MPYTHITRGQFKTQLASRLSDIAKVYWTDDELNILITEGLRTWGILSGFWRERSVINLIPGIAFYDIPSSITPLLLDYTVTDYDVIKSIQYHLLENASSQAVWNGTEMFSLSDLSNAIYRRMNQFIQDTGIIISLASQNLPAPPAAGRVTLSDNIIDVRRLLWIDSSGRIYRLNKEDEFSLTAYDPTWAVSPDVPNSFSILASRPVEIQIAPPPVVSSSIEMLVVQSTATLNPAISSTILSLFDDLTPFIKFGAMADCLGNDGPARDPIRAEFCEQRYRQGVELTKLLSSVVAARINDVPTRPVTLMDLDRMYPNWQNKTGSASELSLAGWNLLGVYPVPSNSSSVTLDFLRKSPIPTTDNTFMQIGREQIGSILDYCEHLALFKVGGVEFLSTQRQATDFLMEAITYNSRLSASARYIFNSKVASQEEFQVNPRIMKAESLGAMSA